MFIAARREIAQAQQNYGHVGMFELWVTFFSASCRAAKNGSTACAD
ncbi:MAG: hypothetical protein AAFV72_22520 [Cyanobacteria bacterium J06635_1]